MKILDPDPAKTSGSPITNGVRKKYEVHFGMEEYDLQLVLNIGEGWVRNLRLPDHPRAGRLVLVEPDLLLHHLKQRVVVVHILYEDSDAGGGLRAHARVGTVQGRHGQRVPTYTDTISRANCITKISYGKT